jgi:mannan endo-1,4-beta-mannosidase
VRYIRLLSKFVTAGMDCNGEVDGEAYIDSCGVCAGGTTGITPSLDADSCPEQIHPRDPGTMYVAGRHLYTVAGEKVILRGVNEMFVWSDDKRGIRLIPEIAQTGSNCVRLVWTEEYGNKYTLVDLIERCIDHKMIAMPECHSATGDWDNLDVCINFWNHPGLIDCIQTNKKWTLLNIGNEVGDGNVTATQFKEGYKRAIDSLRGWGYTVPLVIDASTWGQNVDVVFETWREILEHDPLHNILFSVHSYWSDINNYSRVATESIREGLPVIIGEGPSPTAYPNCHILDYGTGLEVTGEHDIGWLSWSWGGTPNGHCIPNFDHTYDGEFGRWRTSYAAEMMVDHPYSLLRTAERPPSFFPDDHVPVAGIYLSPAVSNMDVGSSLQVEVLVTPVNAVNQAFTVEISGDQSAVSYDPETGALTAQEPGSFTVTATSSENPEISFSRNITVNDIPVSSIAFSPSEAQMMIGDTLYFSVEVLPENATVKNYTFQIVDTASILDIDTITGRVVAVNAGTARIKAKWVNGDITGTLDITVSDNTFSGEENSPYRVSMFPNPNRGTLHISCNRTEPMELKFLHSGGKLHIHTEYNSSIVLDTSEWPKGTYIVVHKGNDRIISQKLVIL